MAIFNILSNADWDSYDGPVGGSIQSRSGDSFVYLSLPGYAVTVTGTGFAYDAEGIAIGGTVTSLDV